MRIAKKIIFICLAILPVFALLQVLLFSTHIPEGGTLPIVIDTPPAQFVDEGDYILIDTLYSLGLQENPGLLDNFLMPFAALDGSLAAFRLTGIAASVFRLNLYFAENIGIPFCGATFGAFMLLLYWAFLGLVDMLVSLLTFVPRKVSDIFT